MLKEEYIVYLWIYIDIKCGFCKYNTKNHLKFGEQIIRINTDGKSLIMKSSPESPYVNNRRSTFGL